MQKYIRIGLFSLIGMGIVLRFFSVGWNILPHGDIVPDALAANTMYLQGNFHLSDDTTLPPGNQYHVQHPPIWAFLGAGIMHITKVDAFTALKILSLICGLLILPMSYRVSSLILSKDESLFLTCLLAVSWLMIDFSGNGALYSMHALLFLLWIDCAMRKKGNKAFLLGVISGIAYLTNYQTIVLVPASLVVLALEDHSKWKSFAVYTGTLLLLISPWLVRNSVIFGDAMFGHTINTSYIFLKSGSFSPDYIYTPEEKIKALKMIFTRWLPFNLYFASRKLFILAPIIFIPFSYSLADHLCNKKNIRTFLPILLILFLYLGIATAWPVVKFRYFVPLLPLVLLLGVEQVKQLPIVAQRKNQILGATLGCFIIFSALTYHQIPTHTYYYDGAITQDTFHGEGEIKFMIDNGILER